MPPGLRSVVCPPFSVLPLSVFGFLLAFTGRVDVEYGCGGRNPPRGTTGCTEISDASPQTVRFVSKKRLEGSVLSVFAGSTDALCLSKRHP